MMGLEVEGRPLTRAYSVVSANYDDYLEFLSIKVPDGALTSRLQHVKEGDRILVGKKPTGTLVISNLRPGRNLYLLGTGTGLAPFMSIIRDPETYDQFEKVVLVHGCRLVSELAYGDRIMRELPADEYLGDLIRSRLIYFPTVTREPFKNRGRITEGPTVSTIRPPRVRPTGRWVTRTPQQGVAQPRVEEPVAAMTPTDPGAGGRAARELRWEATFPAEAPAVRQCRQQAEHALRGAGVPSGAIQDAIAVLGELAGNAVRHTATEFQVLVLVSPGVVRVEVADLDTRPPALLGLDVESTSGRGLHLVALIAHDWGWQTAQSDSGVSGKKVWAELSFEVEPERG